MGAGLGRLDYFSLGKNNSLRSDIFFLAGKIIQPPRPSQYRGIGGEDNCKRWKRKLNQKPENDQKQTGTPSKRSTGRGVVREFFLRKRCLSEASCFSQKKFSGHPATTLPNQRRNKQTIKAQHQAPDQPHLPEIQMQTCRSTCETPG